ncbi:hypothetical protein F8O07_06935 [Pseudoclavibacter sp. CFCC 13796]|uniref:hypothetical protein n=1 Tax=Pseudoclavibacter sp. CFCC 13796 TaxID=2615179 RepID=UPI001301671A|nr:hypothetical protein [Pseudoclavibacter sp. CFCC 13796]KAB1661634.1 hypothetical protein F8O07_06935 [Pseudoclavibacter sp. CFCC 13796]
MADLTALAQQPRDFLGRWIEHRNSIPEIDPLMTSDEYYAGSTWDKPAAPRDPQSLYRFWTDPALKIHPNAILNFIDMHDEQADIDHRLFLQFVAKAWRGQRGNGEKFDRGDPRAKADWANVEKTADKIWFHENAAQLNPNTAEVVFRSSKILWQSQLFYDEADRDAVRQFKVIMPVHGNPEVTIQQVEGRYRLVEEYTPPTVPGVYRSPLLGGLGKRAAWEYPARYESTNFNEQW